VLDALRRDPGRSAIVADFDGSLGPIVADPAAALALPAALTALEALVGRFGTVAVVSGRPAAFLAERLPVDGLAWVADDAERTWPDLHVGRKGGLAVTLDWRGQPSQGDDAAAWADALATELGLDVVPGRMAREFRCARERGARGRRFRRRPARDLHPRRRRR